MKTYIVTRNIILEESCKVEANNKKEAIIKAKDNNFKEDKYEDGDTRYLFEWDGGVFTHSNNYIAEEEEDDDDTTQM